MFGHDIGKYWWKINSIGLFQDKAVPNIVSSQKKKSAFAFFLLLFLLSRFFSLILVDKHATGISELSTSINQVRVCGKNGIKTRSRLDVMISLEEIFFFFLFFLCVYIKVDDFHRDECLLYNYDWNVDINFLLNDHHMQYEGQRKKRYFFLQLHSYSFSSLSSRDHFISLIIFISSTIILLRRICI